MVKRVSGVDFTVEIAPRRPGDPAQIVAASERARTTLGWTPRFDDLATIIGHALGWEQSCDRVVGCPPNQGSDDSGGTILGRASPKLCAAEFPGNREITGKFS